MKFNAIFNNSYRTKTGKLMHVYAIQLPAEMSVTDFHNKVSDIKARALCDNGSPRFNAWEADFGENPPANIEVWLTKDGRLSNLTAVNNLKAEQEAFNKVARLSGVNREVLATQALSMLLGVKADATTVTAQAPAEATPVEEIDGVM